MDQIIKYYRLEKCVSLVEYENNKNNNINTCLIEFAPEFKEKIENVKSQIKQLDVSYQIIALSKPVNLKFCYFIIRKL